MSMPGCCSLALPILGFDMTFKSMFRFPLTIPFLFLVIYLLKNWAFGVSHNVDIFDHTLVHFATSLHLLYSLQISTGGLMAVFGIGL